MELEHNVSCPHCKKYNFICVRVPESAWQMNGAYWVFVQPCNYCDKDIELEGQVESSLETY